MAEVLLEGKADAVLAASIFHFGTYTVGDVQNSFEWRRISRCASEKWMQKEIPGCRTCPARKVSPAASRQRI